MPANRLFREEAVDRMRSPDELDRLLTVADRKVWLGIVALLITLAAAIVWSFAGRIPETVAGLGVLITPGTVRGLQASAGGQIVELRVRPGQVVQANDVIAVLNQEALQKEILEEQNRLAEQRSQNDIEAKHDQQRLALKQAASQERQRFILEEIEKAQELDHESAQQTDTYVRELAETLGETRLLNERMNETLKRKLKTLKNLMDEGLTSDDVLIETESNVMESELRLANLDVDIQQLELQKIENAQTQLQQQNRIADLRLSLLDLQVESRTLEQEIEQNRISRDSQLTERERRIEMLQFLLEKQSKILAPFGGRVLELTVAPGQVVTEGTRLGTIQLDEDGSTLQNLAYFSVKDGKRIQPGLAVHITPSTVLRERFGSIVGRVTKVSEFPITEEGAVNVVGNPSIAEALIQRGGAIEVEMELLPDPDSVSGFQWTSAGPPMKFTAGTTTTVRVTIEERAPITYVLPILRTWFMGQKDHQLPTL